MPPGLVFVNPIEQQRPLADVLGAWLHAVGLSHLAGMVPGATTESSPVSPIVEGYANAMYKLGRRYESDGALGNRREALRCYCKSARLGNARALAHLAACWMRFGTGKATGEQAPDSVTQDHSDSEQANQSDA